MQTRELLARGSVRVQSSGVYVPLALWSLAGLACWYYVGRGLLAPVGHRVPWSLQTLSPNGWFVLVGEMLEVARQTGWLTVAGLILVIRMALSPAVDAWVYHRLAGRRGKPAWKGFYGLNLVMLLGTGLLGWILYVHVGALISLTYQPLLALGWGLAAALGLFVSGMVLSWYKLRLNDKVRVLWPRIGVWIRVAGVQVLLSALFGLLIGIIHYLSVSATGVLLVALLILSSLVRMYGKLWKMACAITLMQAR